MRRPFPWIDALPLFQQRLQNYLQLNQQTLMVQVSTASGSVTSAPAEVTVLSETGQPLRPEPTITHQPIDRDVAFGGTAKLTVTAVSIFPISY